MEFKEKMVSFLKDNGVEVSKVEQKENVKSIVCHISQEANSKIDEIKDLMEKDCDVAIMRSENYGMNVVIIEANDLEN